MENDSFGKQIDKVEFMGEVEMVQIVELIDEVINDIENETLIANVKSKVKSLCKSFPIYRELYE